jgi:oligopeptide transport system substrate-binding protein
LDFFEVWWMAREALDVARRRHPGEYVPARNPGTLLATSDVARPPVDDVRVRRAFAMAVSRTEFPDVAGAYLPAATSGFVPEGVPGYSAGIALPFDNPEARRLLAEAG